MRSHDDIGRQGSAGDARIALRSGASSGNSREDISSVVEIDITYVGVRRRGLTIDWPQSNVPAETQV